MMYPLSPASSPWSSSLITSPSLVQNPTVLTPPDTWMPLPSSNNQSYPQQTLPSYTQQVQPSVFPGQSLNDTPIPQQGPAPTTSYPHQPLNAGFAQQAPSSSNNRYLQPQQLSGSPPYPHTVSTPTVAQHPARFPTPGEPQSWTEHGMGEIKAQMQWRSSHDAAVGNMDASRVRRVPRIRNLDPSQDQKLRNGDYRLARQHLNPYASTPDVQAPMYSEWANMNGSRNDGAQLQPNQDMLQLFQRDPNHSFVPI